jgi:hypothetical protein
MSGENTTLTDVPDVKLTEKDVSIAGPGTGGGTLIVVLSASNRCEFNEMNAWWPLIAYDSPRGPVSGFSSAHVFHAFRCSSVSDAQAALYVERIARISSCLAVDGFVGELR